MTLLVALAEAARIKLGGCSDYAHSLMGGPQ